MNECNTFPKRRVKSVSASCERQSSPASRNAQERYTCDILGSELSNCNLTREVSDLDLNPMNKPIETWLQKNPAFLLNFLTREGASKLINDYRRTETDIRKSISAPGNKSASLIAKEQSDMKHDWIRTKKCDQLDHSVSPVRKISASDLESKSGSGYLRPMVNVTPDGQPTFLTVPRDRSPGSLSLSSLSVASSHGSARQFGYRHGSITSVNRDVDQENEALKESEKLAGKLDENELLRSLFEKQERFNRDRELKLIFELVKDIYDDLDIEVVLHKILRDILILIDADKSSLFLVSGDAGSENRHLVSFLFDVSQEPMEVNDKTKKENYARTSVKIPWGEGLVGHVAESGESLNIVNCYDDKRFNPSMDQLTGYLTKHMLCSPIRDKSNEIVGVAQVINRHDGQPFDSNDEEMFKRYLQFCGLVLRNAQIYESINLENRRCQVLLDLARMVFEEQSSIERIIHRIMLHVQQLFECSRCQVLLIDVDPESDFSDYLLHSPRSRRSKKLKQYQIRKNKLLKFKQVESHDDFVWQPRYVSEDLQDLDHVSDIGNSKKPDKAPDKASKLFSLAFDLDCNLVDEVITSNYNSNPENTRTDEGSSHQSRRPEIRCTRFPINFEITCHVAETGKTLNIPDAYKDERFDPSVDKGTNFRHKSILCMPIRNGRNQIIGVTQLINKKNDEAFNTNDENLLEAFAIFCGLGIQNTLMYEKLLKIMAKQRVTFEVLSYHATAPLEEARKLYLESIPSAKDLDLLNLRFSYFLLSEDMMLKSCIRFFEDLDLVQRFKIDKLVLCNWLLSVQKNYRNVVYYPKVDRNELREAPIFYHNWRHAFNVGQMMFAILSQINMTTKFGELETLALIIACLCHDLDHRGTNNTFQVTSSSPLADLYSTSTMEHHHFDQCVMILNSQNNQILANLTPKEYSRVIRLIEEAILATDLAMFFQEKHTFLKHVNEKTFNFEGNRQHRSLLRGILMTACDLGAITKHWNVHKVVAELVKKEFCFQAGSFCCEKKKWLSFLDHPKAKPLCLHHMRSNLPHHCTTGDIEEDKMESKPTDMVDRDKRSELPEMQIKFIDLVGEPIFSALAKLFPKLTPLLVGCRKNREKWVSELNKLRERHAFNPNVASTCPRNYSGTPELLSKFRSEKGRRNSM